MTSPSHSLPRISIITATFNVASDLPQLIESIRCQTYQNIQWIVVDGDSNDNTVQLLRDAKTVVSYWLSEPDQGIYDAWNKGLEFVDGDWVLFLGADDYLAADETLFDVAKILAETSPDTYWVYGKINQHGPDGTMQILGKPWHQVKTEFNSVMNIPHTGLFHKKALFETCGKFDVTYRIAGDYAFLLKAVWQGFTPIFLPIFIANMGGEGVSTRPESALLALRESARARREIDVRPVYSRKWCWDFVKACSKVVLYKVLDPKSARKVVNVYRRLTGRQDF